MTNQQATATKWMLGVAGAIAAAIALAYWNDSRNAWREAVAQADKVSLMRHLAIREEWNKDSAAKDRTIEKLERRIEKLEDRR